MEVAFRKAREAYRALGEPYSFIMSAFVSDDESAYSHSERFREHLDSPTGHFAYVLLAEAALESSERRRPARQYTDVPYADALGVLGLPSGIYLNLAVALSEADSNSTRRIARSLLPFVTAFDLALTQARQNEYHWKRLALPFHPAEPDILGVAILVETYLLRRQLSILSILETIPISILAAEVIKNALELRFPPKATAAGLDPG